MQVKVSKRFHPIIVFAIVGFFAMMASTLTRRSVCVITKIFGIPCPACGMTRSQIAFIRLDIMNAFRYHPLFLTPLLISLLALFDKLTDRIIISMIVLFIGVWIVRMILFYPNQAPMVFNEQGFIPQLIGILRNR